MGKLRDIFAAVGLCDDTESYEKKPALIDEIITRSFRSLPRDSAYFGQRDLYTERLATLLDLLKSRELSLLNENKIIIYPDVRLNTVELDFFDAGLNAVYYNGSEQKILSLHDDGKDLLSPYYPSMRNNVDALKDIVSYLSKAEVPPLLFYHAVLFPNPVLTQYWWKDARKCEKIMRENASLLMPPIQKKDGTVNAYSPKIK